MHQPHALPLKTLLSDMGNVLVFFSHERMCVQIGEVCGRSAADVRQHLLDSSLQWEFERGLIDESQLHARLEELFQCRISLPDLVRATGDIFELNSTIVPVLAALKKRGMRLVLLSNTCISHVNFIREHWDVLDLFDHLVLSYEVGSVKPEDGIYLAALKEIGCRPEECLYIDDISTYIDKGRTFGLNAEVFTTTAHFLDTLGDYGIQLDD
ncbi:HAD family hydrolase [Planctomicrobium sp. SH661]|uniref:HAD family hydrolase n=1 Tax=Planctomicrobium sp. SH661 TaxID=3448124 RepID=UPI003F5C79B3